MKDRRPEEANLSLRAILLHKIREKKEHDDRLQVIITPDKKSSATEIAQFYRGRFPLQ